MDTASPALGLRTRLPHVLATLYGVAIVYASLEPFHPWLPPQTPFFLFVTGQHWIRYDALLNALAYVPFGFFVALLRRGAMSLKLTDRYVVLQRGIVSRHTSTVMLNRVESLDVDQSLWQRMTGYGTLTVRGTGSEDLRLAGITDPVGFQTAARQAIHGAAGGANF